MTHNLRVLSAIVAVLTFTLGVGGQELPVSRSVDYLYQHGIQLTLDSTTDSLLVSDSNRADGTAETWLDLGANIQLAELSPKLSRTRAFFSLHANGNWNSGLGGAVQSISGIQSHAGVYAAEIWVEQPLASGVRLRAGKIDGNRDFAYVENATSFVNTADGYNPSFFLLPNYNATQPGAELLVDSRGARLNVAAFKNPGGHGVLLVEEGGVRWKPKSHTGRVVVGGWQSTEVNLTLDGNMQRGLRGAYAVAEQTFWRVSAGSDRTAAVFIQWGSAPSQFSTFVRHAEAGLLLKAPFGSRAADALGFSVSRGRLTPLASAFASATESVWETVYRAQITPKTTISPDLQYVAHPSGIRHNAIAVGIRLNINLLSHRD